MKYIIVVDKQSRTNPSTEKRETTIEIEELRRKGNVHDDFVIEKGIAKVYRRLGLTRTLVTYVLDNEVIEDLGEIKIKLFEGDNYIYIKDEYNNQMCAEYIVKSDFTDMYVTNLKMESAIEESARQINLFVSQVLESYSTTEETKALIQLLANQINLELEKKVNGETITGAYLLLKINEDTSKAKLSADKIELSANDILNLLANNEINLTAKNTTIKSTNFSVDKNGNMKCTNANISGSITSSNANISGGKIELISEADSDFANTAFIVNTKTGSYWTRIKPHWIAMGGGSSNGQAQIYNSDDYKRMSLSSGSDTSQLIVAHTIESGEAASIWSKGYADDPTTKTKITQNGITTPKLTQTSLKSKKKYIKKLKVNATDLIKNSDICLYNLKGEKAKSKKHIGLVIGDGYNCPEEVISEDGQGVEQYSMTSLAWKAIQEQQEIIENLKQRIEKLEAK